MTTNEPNTTTVGAEALETRWRATSLDPELAWAAVGEQRQTYVHADSFAGITCRWIVMAPGHAALTHAHPHSRLVMAVIQGHVSSVLLHQGRLVTESHQRGDTIIIDAGGLHLGVNLSTRHPVTIFEVGTSEWFHSDVVRLPDWDQAAAELATRLQTEFVESDTDRYSVVDVLLAELLREYQR